MIIDFSILVQLKFVYQNNNPQNQNNILETIISVAILSCKNLLLGHSTASISLSQQSQQATINPFN